MHPKKWSRNGMKENTDGSCVINFQVLASELTTGYETMANLQLFKVNGRPILNLKQLASVLDEITKPFSKSKDSQDPGDKMENILTTESCVKVNSLSKQAAAVVDKSSEPNQRQSDNIIPLKEVGAIDDSDQSRSCAKLKTLEDVKKDSERGSLVCESENVSLAHYRNTAVECRKQDFVKADSCSSDSLFLSTTHTVDTSSGVEEDPTLLNREDFVHFELDKDKIIVLHIPTAYKAAPEILQQYAIGQPRSDDLPPPP